MNNNKYYEAAFRSNLNQYIKLNIEYLTEIIESEPKVFYETYSGNLFCPECFKPQLTLVMSYKTGKYYLRGYPKQKHENNCYHGFEPVKSNIFNDFCQDTKTHKFIKNKLQKLINKMLNNCIESENPFLIKVIKENCSIVKISDKDIKEKRNIHQIPNKSLTSIFDDDDFEVFKLFYGNVDLILIERISIENDRNFYMLKINKKNGNYICSLSMTKIVATYLMNLYNIKTDVKVKNVYISFAAKLKKNGFFKNGKLIHSDLCIINRI